MTHKAFSQACENNKAPILQMIRSIFYQPATVWEIGVNSLKLVFDFAMVANNRLLVLQIS